MRKKMDMAHQKMQREINAENRKRNQDRNDPAHDRKDRNKDVAARNDERHERHQAMAKRDRDARNIWAPAA